MRSIPVPLTSIFSWLWLLKWKFNFYISGQSFEVEINDYAATFEITTFSSYQSICMPPKPVDQSYIVDCISLASSNSVIYVVGAYIGVETCLLADKATQGKIISFEPHPRNFEKLERNVEINNFTNVCTYNVALSNVNREQRLITKNDGAEPSSNILDVQTPESSLSNGSNESSHSANVVQGDKFIKQQNIPLPESLIITASGAEVNVIEGLSDTVKSNCDTIYCEVIRDKLNQYGENPESLHETLESMGFNISVLDCNGSDDHYFIRADN